MATALLPVVFCSAVLIKDCDCLLDTKVEMGRDG